jgi:phage terminase large subunit-like protein
MVWHRVYTPTAKRQIDFEVIEAALLELKQRFRLKEVRYDPYQLAAVAQRLLKAGVPMVEYPQSPANITEASTCLYDLITGKNLRVYPDKAFRLAVSRAVAKEIPPRGWKITKEKSSHKIDCVVALGMAALGAVEGGIVKPPLVVSQSTLNRASRPTAYTHRYPESSRRTRRMNVFF